MSITIFTDNKMENLAEMLGEKLQGELACKGIFHQAQVIVPNRGIARFLTLRFTEQHQVIMGMEFPYLMTFLLRNIGRVSGDVQEQGEEAHELCNWDALINTESLTFRINGLLPELTEHPEFHLLKRYVCGENSALRRWQLAKRLAALFDRYILYRPNWILHWEENNTPLPELGGRFSNSEKWQRSLWRAVRKDWPQKSGRNEAVHFAHIYRQICSGEWKLNFKEPVRLFGFSTLPSPVLECLEKLDVEVEIYSLSPCAEYWGDAKNRKAELVDLIGLWESVRSQGVQPEQAESFFKSQEELFFQHNPLLGSFAAQGRKFFVRSLEWEHQPLFEQNDAPETLLAKVQNALCSNQPAPVCETVYTGEPDTSIQLHNCYSEFREVEALHDYLLGCFAKDKSLTFNDVIIMSPAPERYAPFLEAVFHNPANGENMLKIACSERAAIDKITAMEGFLKLLQCYQGTFDASGIMEILAIPEVLENFHVTEEDLKFIRQAVHDAGICWGWDEDEHEAHGGVAFSRNSWREGLDRMLLGYAVMAPAQLRTDAGSLYGISNFSDNGELLGNFCRFAEELRKTALWMREKSQEPVSVKEWCSFLLERAATFFGTESALCSLLRPQLANLQRNAGNSLCGDARFEADVIFAVLQEIQENIPESSRDFLRGKITFCNLRPMRSIPGKIVCLLGMNHDTFPREGSADSFDLMRDFPCLDDPALLDDERQLFLEILLSARKELYISYCGQGIRDNKEYPASSCVEELRGYLKDAFGKGSWYEAKEPLQAFDPSLFKSGNPVHSHSQVLCRCAGELREKREQQNCGSENFFQLSAVPGEIPEELCQLSLKGLISFFSNPAAAFIRRRLNAVPVEEEEIQLPETEPLFIGWSDFADQEYTCRRILETPEEEQSQLRQELLDRMQSDGKAPLYRQLDSEWPLWNESRELCQIIRPFLGGELRTEKNRIVEIGKFSVALPEMTFYNDVLVLPLFASWEGSVYRFTLTHIAANLLGGAVETMVIGKEKTYRLLPLGSEKAAERMAKILSLYEEGMCEPLCFFPKTSWAVLQYDPDEEIRKIQEVWENENAKFGKYYGDVLPDIGILQNNAERFFANLNMAGEKEE